MEFYPFLYPPRDRSINVSKKKKKKKKKEIKPITRFQLTSLGRRLFAPSICLSFVQADHFNFGHARDTIIHWLFRPCTKSISLYYVDLNSPGLFSLRLSPSLTSPPSLAHLLLDPRLSASTVYIDFVIYRGPLPTKEKWKFDKSIGTKHEYEGRREIFEEKEW